jgi:dihydrofolate reductase
MGAAKEAAGEKDVLVHGVGTAQLALAAGVLDELQIHLVPVLLGEGRRLFEHLGADHIELEPTPVLEDGGVTHLRYRVDARATCDHRLELLAERSVSLNKT